MRTYIIAEAGVNHNGSRRLAIHLVDVAAEAGADAVKFQTFRADRLAINDAPKADYQQRATGAQDTQREMLGRLELSIEDHLAIAQHCKERGIDFMSSPFDEPSVDVLVQQLGLRRIKIASGEIVNGPLLLHIARSGADVILSTGMSTLSEVEMALAVLSFGFVGGDGAPSWERFWDSYYSPEGRAALEKKVVLLHCTSEYPAPFEYVNLRAMDTLHSAFALPVGLSDHTQGIAVSIAAVARGARVIEKHITLDKSMPGPDHSASLNPEEFKALVQGIRQVEHALGSAWKGPSPSELANRVVARKSLVARTSIARGEAFTPDNLTCKRPAGGISPMWYWDLLGKPAQRDYAPDEVIVPWSERS